MSANNKCPICTKTAYPMESVNVDGKQFHKLCFKCTTCKQALNMKNYKLFEGNVYCTTHTPKATTGAKSAPSTTAAPARAEPKAEPKTDQKLTPVAVGSAAASNWSFDELNKLEREFKKSGGAIQSKQELLDLLLRVDLLRPIVNQNLQRSGKENLSSLEKTILDELYKDQAFMDVVVDSLFNTLDTDRSGSIDWQELVIGLAVVAKGSKSETARLKFKVIDLDNSGSLDRTEYKKMAEYDLRSILAATRIGFKVGFKIGVELEADDDEESEFLLKAINDLPFDEIFADFEKAVTADEMLNHVCDMVFEYADSDNNGTISEEEYVRWTEDVTQQGLLAFRIQGALAPYLQDFQENVQEAFIQAIQENMQ